MMGDFDVAKSKVLLQGIKVSSNGEISCALRWETLNSHLYLFLSKPFINLI